MADFTTWQRDNLENVARDMLEALKDWKAKLDKEIEIRRKPGQDAEIRSYNEKIIFGLELSLAMMQDAMHKQTKAQQQNESSDG